MKINDAGIVERGDWLSITPVRGVEKLAIGKTMEQVPKIASRVCGICPIAHTLAATEAMEASIKCEIPKDAYLLRVILQAANRLHSHALHNILTLPDMYLPGTDKKINPFAKEEPVRSVAGRGGEGRGAHDQGLAVPLRRVRHRGRPRDLVGRW